MGPTTTTGLRPPQSGTPGRGQHLRRRARPLGDREEKTGTVGTPAATPPNPGGGEERTGTVGNPAATPPHPGRGEGGTGAVRTPAAARPNRVVREDKTGAVGTPAAAPPKQVCREERTGTVTEATEGEGRMTLGVVPAAEGANPAASGAASTPHSQRDASRTPKRNRCAYTTEDRLRDERERTNLRDAMYTPQATPNRGRIAGPPRGDVERSGALHGQHTPANRWGGPQIEAPPLMTAPPRGDAERDGAPRSQHTPANLWGGPRTEAPPFKTAHEAGRYGRVRVEVPKTNNQLRLSITGGTEGPVSSLVRFVQRGKHGSLPVSPSFSKTSILETMYWMRKAARDRAHIARPPRGDAERSDELRDQHTPALIPPSP